MSNYFDPSRFYDPIDGFTINLVLCNIVHLFFKTIYASEGCLIIIIFLKINFTSY